MTTSSTTSFSVTRMQCMKFRQGFSGLKDTHVPSKKLAELEEQFQIYFLVKLMVVSIYILHVFSSYIFFDFMPRV